MQSEKGSDESHSIQFCCSENTARTRARAYTPLATSWSRCRPGQCVVETKLELNSPVNVYVFVGGSTELMELMIIKIMLKWTRKPD